MSIQPTDVGLQQETEDPTEPTRSWGLLICAYEGSEQDIAELIGPGLLPGVARLIPCDGDATFVLYTESMTLPQFDNLRAVVDSIEEVWDTTSFGEKTEVAAEPQVQPLPTPKARPVSGALTYQI